MYISETLAGFGLRERAKYTFLQVRGAAPFGTVSPGQRAALLLLDANPLTEMDSISRIVA